MQRCVGNTSKKIEKKGKPTNFNPKGYRRGNCTVVFSEFPGKPTVAFEERGEQPKTHCVIKVSAPFGRGGGGVPRHCGR